jgi:hypothetical protein
MDMELSQNQSEIVSINRPSIHVHHGIEGRLIFSHRINYKDSTHHTWPYFIA